MTYLDYPSHTSLPYYPQWLKFMKIFTGKSQKLAVILVVFLSLSLGACRRGDRGSPSGDTIQIDALWVKNEYPPVGGFSPIFLEITDSASDEMSLGVSETESGGAGDLLRSASWMAATNTRGYAS